jgi:hypothetical protein
MVFIAYRPAIFTAPVTRYYTHVSPGHCRNFWIGETITPDVPASSPSPPYSVREVTLWCRHQRTPRSSVNLQSSTDVDSMVASKRFAATRISVWFSDKSHALGQRALLRNESLSRTVLGHETCDDNHIRVWSRGPA